MRRQMGKWAPDHRMPNPCDPALEEAADIEAELCKCICICSLARNQASDMNPSRDSPLGIRHLLDYENLRSFSRQA